MIDRAARGPKSAGTRLILVFRIAGIESNIFLNPAVHVSDGKVADVATPRWPAPTAPTRFHPL